MSTTTALKVPPSSSTPASPAKSKPSQSTPDGGSADAKGKGPVTANKSVAPEEVTSPHELTAYVETLLDSLESKFDEMSTQILDRMSQMSSRVDALEASIQDILNGDITNSAGASVPQSPSPAPISR